MKKVALSMIVRDDKESNQLYRCLSSLAANVDGIFITITGSPHEKIKEIAESFKANITIATYDKNPELWLTYPHDRSKEDWEAWKPLLEKQYQDSYEKWIENLKGKRIFSFQNARNFALKQIPPEFEYFVWTDADDVWQNAKLIRDMITLMEKDKITSIYLDYNYEIGADGKVNIVHPRERIMKRGYYEWKAHIHETMIPTREVNNAYYKDIKVNHYPTEEQKGGNIMRNLEILEAAYFEEEKEIKAKKRKEHDPRTEYYLARNYFDVGLLKEATKLFKDYLTRSGWDEERAMACNYIGLIYIILKDFENAKEYFLKAISNKPNFPTWYVNLAFLYAKMGNWEDAKHYARLFTHVKLPKTSIVQVPIDDEMRYYETIFMIAMGQRDVAAAKESVLEMTKRVPNDETYKKRLEGLQRLEFLTEATKGFDLIIQELVREKEEHKINSLINSLPVTLIDNAFVEQIRLKYTPPKTWAEGSIVYWAGRSFEEWTPDSLKTGVGGSEAAIIQLARHWAAKGRKVTVYGNAGAHEGIYDNVEYLNYYRFNRFDTFDNLIVWRAPWELDTAFKAKHIYLDLHDVPNPAEFTPERLKHVDKIFVKSKYHRNFLPDIADDKFAIIPNGVDGDMLRFNKVEKSPYRMIYSSSYDRGLEQMLEWGWPIIKKEIPEATLDIYYGWNLFDAIHRNNPERMMYKKKLLGLMSQPGVTERGRIGQEKLIEEKSKSSIHYYAATFEEIDCISVRESAAVGTIPVTTDFAALKEKDYVEKIKGSPYKKETHEAIAERIVFLLKNPLVMFPKRKEFKEKARLESWNKISDLWIKYF